MNEHKMWNPRKMIVLHNSRETLTRLLYRRIRHLCTTYKMQNVITSIPSMLYMYDVPVVWSKMIGYDNLMQCGMMLWDLLTSSLFTLFHCLKALFFFSFVCVWPLLHNAQTKIVNGYMREQTWGTRDDMIPRWYLWYGMYAMEGVDH